MFFHIHEHEGRQFQSTNNHFNSGTSVSTTAPRVLNVGDFTRIDTKGFREHAVTVLNTLFHPVDFQTVLGTIKHVMSHHLERGEVAS